VQAVNNALPEVAAAMRYRGSLYTGVPDNFYVNRHYIAMTRKRENDVYAFA
jgi:hypothetical protein